MKVAQVSKHFPPFRGGLESRVYDLARWIVARGDSVSVFTSREPGTDPEEDMQGVRVHRSQSIVKVFNALFCPGIFIDLLDGDYDVADVHLPDPANSIFTFIAAKLRGKPYVVTYHADIIKEKWYHMPFKLAYNLVLGLVLSNARAIFVTSPNYVKGSPALLRYRDKIVVAPSFIDPKVFHAGFDGAKVREKWDLDDDKIILFVGRLIEYKGLEYLIKAFSNLKLKVGNARLLIIGTGPLNSSLKSLVKELRLDNVLFLGEVSGEELVEYYSAADVFALPSINRAEAFGLVLVEAMACGTPTVTSDFSGMPFVVGDCGLKAKPGDIASLESCLLKVLTDDEKAKSMRECGLKRVKKYFTSEVVSQKVWSVYKSVCDKSYSK